MCDLAVCVYKCVRVCVSVRAECVGHVWDAFVCVIVQYSTAFLSPDPSLPSLPLPVGYEG